MKEDNDKRVNIQRRSLAAALASGLFFPALTATTAASESKGRDAPVVRSGKHTLLDFADAFPVRFYEKSYFGLSVLVASMVVAGVFSYLTAGAGAPSAAVGVSSVASWVAGGGAGSYMAGLSTIGGWFGGNAMVGSAILNGISLGTIGTGAVGAGWTTVATMSKVVAAAAVSATVLDGIALFKAPDTQSLQVTIDLPVPRALGTEEVRDFVEDYLEQRKKIQDLLVKLGGAMENNGLTLDNVEMTLNQRELAHLQESGKLILHKIEAKIQRDELEGKLYPADVVVYAVLSRAEGNHQNFADAINKLKVLNLESKSYLTYLIAIAELDKGRLGSAEHYLRMALRESPYALEPAALLINLLALEGFKNQEKDIVNIVDRAEDNFNANKYRSSLSLVSINYRMAANYLAVQDYKNAAFYFDRAYKRFGRIQRFSTFMGWGADDGGMAYNPLIPFVLLGKANAMYGLGDKEEADIFFCKEVLSRAGAIAKTEELQSSYFGGVDLICP